MNNKIIISEMKKDIDILCPDIEISISPAELELIIQNSPRNSFACLYNKSFEDNDFVFILNSQWKFWDSFNQQILSWDWISDINSIIASYNEDSDDDSLKEFFHGWIYSNNSEFDFQENITMPIIDSLSIHIDVKTLISSIQTKEQKALTILNERGLSDLERVQKILKLR